MSLTKTTYSMISGATANVFDFMTEAEIADVTSRTASIDVTSKIQAAIDSVNTGLTVFLPRGTYKTTSTIYLRRSGVHIVGTGPGSTEIKYVNVAGGIVFSGDTNKFNSLAQYESCSLENFEVVRSSSNLVTAATTDPQIVVDLTSFSYSYFNIEVQTVRPFATIFYGQGNAGTAPYFNHIESTGLFGGPDYTQRAFGFEGGAFTGGSNGPNANMIGPITRAASLGTVIDLKVGQGNMFSNIGAESISGTYILLGGNGAVDNGTSSGSNTAITLNDTTKSWGANQFVNGAVQITGGVGAGQIRRIATNTATQIQLDWPWATIPNATSQYSLFNLRSTDNKFVNIRQEGLGSSVFAFAWPDSANTEITQVSVQSTGGYLDDRSCSPYNKFFGQSRTLIQHTFTTPGPNANIDAYPKSSVFGGIKLAGQYVVDFVFVECTATSHGDVASVTVDCGGAVVGGGSPSFAIAVPNGESAGSAFPAFSRVQKNGANVGIFLNLQTGASFSAGVSVMVTIGVTLVGA
jgi:hypothetical protein